MKQKKITDIFRENGLSIQNTSYTCGPCTLLNVLQLKGDLSHTEKELAALCGTTTENATANATLVQAAKQLGLDVIKEKEGASIADVEAHLDQGALVIICYQHAYSGEGHFGLITEHDTEAFYFRDCSYGFFRLRKKYLTKFWYGSDGNKQWYVAIK